jgi:UDP-N-acetylglucosamine 2-epimerase (non-hydrolysing)
VLDERAESVLEKYSLFSILEGGCVETYKKLAHREFVDQLINAAFVITDSGGIQEECAILGIPCLIHRRFTERQDGLGVSSAISQWKPGAIIEFGENYIRYRHDPEQNGISPSHIIWRELVARGYVSG